MIDVIYSGNTAVKREYYEDAQDYREYPRLVYDKGTSGKAWMEEWEAEDYEEPSLKQQLLAGLGFLLLAFLPPVGALVLWGASKAPH